MMKTFRNRFIAVLLAALMALSLCACAQPEAAPAPSAEAVQATPAPTEAPAAPAPAPVVEEPEAFEFTVDWAAEYDVVVVGFGGAGAATAVSAAEAGAKVLLLEKAPKGHEGGNTKVSGQGLQTFNDFDLGVTYQKALLGGFDNVSDAIVETYVRGAMELPDWFSAHGCDTFRAGNYAEYPELAGAEASMNGSIGGQYNGTLYAFLHGLVEDNENIDVWFSSPGVKLIQDKDTKIIHGIQVDMQGTMVNVRAKNGVVLACGGFESNEEMIENYLQMPYGYAKGSKYNTGDGIIMAQKVGAALWHMSAISGPDPNFITEDGQSFGYLMTGTFSPYAPSTAGFAVSSAILVGSDGTRYMDETLKTRHGHINNHGTWVSMQIPTPSFMIFDENARLAGRPIYLSWSLDSSAEIEKGWIKKADTLEELAAIMGINYEGLATEVAKYNQFCADGADDDFDRPADKLVALSTEGPYYALELAPTFTNTQGGPERNENAEIIDLYGEPIPHLYSAGELGSIHADIYNGGGNLAECIVFGRIAGANAAAVKADVSQESAMDGKAPVAPAEEEAIVAAEGELLGESIGMGGKLVVKVKQADGVISSVEVVYHNETAGISDTAIAEMPARIVAANSAEVDIVSGATRTSTAIIEAVKNALAQ